MLNVTEKGMILEILKCSVKQLEAEVDILWSVSRSEMTWNLEQAAIKVFNSMEFISAKC